MNAIWRKAWLYLFLGMIAVLVFAEKSYIKHVFEKDLPRDTIPHNTPLNKLDSSNNNSIQQQNGNSNIQIQQNANKGKTDLRINSPIINHNTTIIHKADTSNTSMVINGGQNNINTGVNKGQIGNNYFQSPSLRPPDIDDLLSLLEYARVQDTFTSKKVLINFTPMSIAQYVGFQIDSFLRT